MAPSREAPRVVGPGEVSGGFIKQFLSHADDGEHRFRDGDEVVPDIGIEVKYGRILDIVAVVREDLEVSEEDRAAGENTNSWLRVRARVSSKEYESVPPGHVLVKGVNSCEAGVDAESSESAGDPEWLPVAAALDSSADDPKGYLTKLFDVYLEGEHNLHGARGRGKVELEDWDSEENVVACPSLAHLWDQHQGNEEVEGVVVSDDALDCDLVQRLREGIDKLVLSQGEPDYHPNTHNVVLDIVHPSLYPYVRGVTKLGVAGGNNSGGTGAESGLDKRAAADPAALSGSDVAGGDSSSGSDGGSLRKDRWGRRYEDSKFQWLPAIFDVSSSGTCSIKSYINNLSMDSNAGLVAALEQLFEKFVPLFESCYSYLQAIRFHETGETDDIVGIARKYEPDLAGSSLRGRELKVVTKIVEYQLGAEDSFDGVWHVEGMSHESILMTGLYILDRDEGFEGGDLLYKRAFLDYEASFIYEKIPQCRHPSTDKLIEDGLRPLGTVPTPKGRMIVFPNSHVHKLSKMYVKDEVDCSTGSRKRTINDCSIGSRKRRIVVFWLVDPEREGMVSTRDVNPPQQLSMSRADALRYRLELMEERKRFKQDWNVRTIELCEH